MKTPIEEAIATLNEAFAADPAAIHALVANRVPCNAALADHPTIVVSVNKVVPETFSIGALGLLNGVMTRLTGKQVAASFSDGEDGTEVKFLGFVEYTPPNPPAP